MKTSYQQAIALQEQWTQAGHPADICRCCGAQVPDPVCARPNTPRQSQKHPF